MADAGDEASEREERDRQASIAAFRSRPRPSGESAYFCRSCGKGIPDERRAAVPGTNVCGFCARHLTGGR